MTDWPVKTLGEVCDLVGGGTPSKDRPEFYGGEIPWATVRDLNVEVLRGTEHSITAEAVKSSSSNIIPSGSVVIATRVGLGKAVIVAQDTAINQDLRGLVVKKPKELMAEYLYWWYLSTVHLVVAAGTGATVQGVKLPFVSGLSIPVPPIEEQKRIVELLDTATARIAELTACYEQARTHANNLFTSALSSALEGNPDWPVKTLGDISEISYGYTESAKSEAVGPKFLRITDIKDRGVNWDDVPYCPIDDVQLNRHRLGDGDIVFARTGATTGKSFLVAKPPLAVCASYLIRLRTDKKIVSPDFLNLNFQTNGYWKQVNEGMSGAAQGGFNASKLGALEIPVPTLEEQKRIVARLDSMKAKTSEMVAAYDAKLSAAKNLRQSILEAAFVGDL